MNMKRFKAGMYLLETLTSGMYNDPLSIYREYIQNSVDSIDLADISKDEAEIKIELDPFDKCVTIFDNGVGISSSKAEEILSSIGSSDKLGKEQRGFRGIGRLGGIAFAKRVIFRSSAKGESIVSTQEWDCNALRSLLGSPKNSSMTIEELFSKVSSFSQEESTDCQYESFFEVKLLEVESYKNYIFDIQKIKKYLTQVAPLPFEPHEFSFRETVSDFLYEKVPFYGEYNIILNGEKLYRPYKDEIAITSRKKNDKIQSVNLFSLKDRNTVIAHGWYGQRKDMLGAISKGEGVSGLRIKVGNLQVGDNHLLDRCFRENRFNSYIVGEIHTCDKNLTPNSRRDDFVDNSAKTILYNLIEKEIGLPLSKQIRHKSRINVASSKSPKTEKILVKGSEVTSNNKEPSISGVKKQLDRNSSDILEKIMEKCGDCATLQAILKELDN